MDKLSIYRKAFKSVAEYLDNEDADVGYLRGMIKGYQGIIELLNSEVKMEVVAVAPAEPEKVENTRKHNRKTYKITQSDLYKMHLLADRGYSQRMIAEAMGLHQSTVSIHLKGYSKRKTTEPPVSVISWIKELAASGKGVEEIATKVGYTTSIVIQYAGQEVKSDRSTTERDAAD